MLRLIKNKQQAEAAKEENKPAEGSATSEEKKDGNAAEGEKFTLKKQSSKEVVEIRKSKSKENVGNVFSLKQKAAGGRAGKKRTTGAELRAQQDMAELPGQPQGFVVTYPDPNNIMIFNVSLYPKDGMYKGAEFKFTITVPPNYPYDAPKVQNNTLTYHPNLDLEGHVCLNILREDWRPVLNLSCVLFGLMTLFLEPNPDDPLNKEAAKLMIENRPEFDRNVKSALRGGTVAGRTFPKLLLN